MAELPVMRYMEGEIDLDDLQALEARMIEVIDAARELADYDSEDFKRLEGLTEGLRHALENYDKGDSP